MLRLQVWCSRVINSHAHSQTHFTDGFLWSCGWSLGLFYARTCSLQWCDARARSHSFDLGIIANTTLANRIPLSSSGVFILGSACFYLTLASIGHSSSLKPFSSSWHTITSSPMEPRPAAPASGVLGLSAVQWGRCAAMSSGAAGRSRSTFSSKVEDLGVHEMQRDCVATDGHA